MEGNYDYDGNGNGNGNNPYPSYPSFQFQPKQQKQTRPSRLGLRTVAGGGGGGGGGEIVEVQGGHIVRSIGRKDRHSKVCTAKGPRDRRVRLSAHTAIQFYDVQDRLGYDRPSKAVDWLIKKAKAAIDELDELPAWKPTAQQNPNPNPNLNPQFEEPEPEPVPESVHARASRHRTRDDNNSNSNSNNNSNDSVGMHFQNGFGSRSQDLQLSLQSFPGPIPQIPQNQNGGIGMGIGSGNGSGNSLYYDGPGWVENGGLSGYGFNNPPQPAQATPLLQPLFGQPTNNQLLLNYISQRGPLQSSNAPPVRAWIDPVPPYSGGTSTVDPQQTLAFHQYHPFSVAGFSSGGFSGFRIPARIQGDDEEHDGISDKPSSGSSDSRH